MQYFEVPEANPGSDGICSDNDCPCGYPGATIPRGTGYMFVSPTVVEFRTGALTVAEAEAKMNRMQNSEGMGFVMFGQDVVTSTLMCEQGARKRGIDLDVAAADAKYWWETGLVPLRATPMAGSGEPEAEPPEVEALPQPTAVDEPAATPAAPAAVDKPAPAPQAPAPEHKWWEFWT